MSSPRWITAESEMRDAVETIISLNPSYIELLHYEFIANVILGISDLNSPALDYNCLERSLTGEYNMETRTTLVNLRKEITTSFVNEYITRMETIRTKPELLMKMKNYETFKFEIFNDIISEIEKTTNVNRQQFSEESFASLLKNIELYATTRYNYYFKTTIENKKVKENDLIDLMNLFYVKAGDKYLTEDKKWKKYILTNMQDEYLLEVK